MSMLANSTSRSDPNLLIDAALHYHDRGWSIIPVAGKRPQRRWKDHQRRRADLNQLRDLVAQPGTTGLAVITGPVSANLGIRDFDQKDAYQHRANQHPTDARTTPTVRTSRGYHCYGTVAGEQYIDFGDGELRADSLHYTLLPPSTHPSGVTYVWIIPLTDTLQPLPSSLAAASPSGDSGIQYGLEDPSHLIACETVQPHPYGGPVEAAIIATLPTGPGQRNRCVFDFARRLKSIDGLTKTDIHQALRSWHRRALAVIGTKDFKVTEVDFWIAWERIKVPHGASIVTAYEAACKHPMPAIDGDVALGVLLSLCCILSQEGSRRFPLSERIVAKLFGVWPMIGWRMLKKLRDHGLIRRAKKGRRKGLRADEYRYLGNRYLGKGVTNE
jgi:hypothetical protein